MGALTPEFLMDLESNMQLVTTGEYQRLLANLWWQKIAKTRNSESKREIITFLLEDAMIERTTDSEISFDDIVGITHELVNEPAAKGLKVHRDQFRDLDGKGVSLATHWSRQMGAYSAYWPQKQVTKAILGNAVTGYDGKKLFADDHPLNPYKPSVGEFSNDIPNVPIHGVGAGSVSVEVALQNLGKVRSHVANIKMANGEDPRFLRVAHIFHPTALTERAVQLTNAKFLAAANGGSSDVEAIMKRYGLGEPVECVEFGAEYGGSDTTYYVGVEQITTDEVGGLVYQERDPFEITYHGPMTDAQLARLTELQWGIRGRNIVGAGHPYLIFRCKAGA